MDDVFKALADATRRRLLDSLNTRDGQSLRELCADLAMTRQAVTKHLAVLESAGLVTVVRRGRERLHYLNAAPVADIADRWINRYRRERVEALSDLKNALEVHPMSKPEFVYVTYIRTTPEKLWRALTEPAFTRRYWGLEFESDWEKGSPLVWTEFGVRISDPEQVVLASEPYRRLSYTWHTFTPEWGAALASRGMAHDIDTIAAEPRSKVTFEIEEAGEAVKLTVVHDGFEPDSRVLPDISQGWPSLLSNLKTMLETGEPYEAPLS
jgi:uncharacterized protein YndB with AHSA1/START domain/DNA-binding transcriptional ArsR family regulator